MSRLLFAIRHDLRCNCRLWLLQTLLASGCSKCLCVRLALNATCTSALLFFPACHQGHDDYCKTLNSQSGAELALSMQPGNASVSLLHCSKLIKPALKAISCQLCKTCCHCRFVHLVGAYQVWNAACAQGTSLHLIVIVTFNCSLE